MPPEAHADECLGCLQVVILDVALFLFHGDQQAALNLAGAVRREARREKNRVRRDESDETSPKSGSGAAGGAEWESETSRGSGSGLSTDRFS